MSTWLKTPSGKYLLTEAYLKGAWDCQSGIKKESFNKGLGANPYKPSCEFAQYDYGYSNEGAGYHDEIDLPFTAIRNRHEPCE